MAWWLSLDRLSAEERLLVGTWTYGGKSGIGASGMHFWPNRRCASDRSNPAVRSRWLSGARGGSFGTAWSCSTPSRVRFWGLFGRSSAALGWPGPASSHSRWCRSPTAKWSWCPTALGNLDPRPRGLTPLTGILPGSAVRPRFQLGTVRRVRCLGVSDGKRRVSRSSLVEIAPGCGCRRSLRQSTWRCERRRTSAPGCPSAQVSPGRAWPRSWRRR